MATAQCEHLVIEFVAESAAKSEIQATSADMHTGDSVCDSAFYNSLAFQALFYVIQTFSLQLYLFSGKILCNSQGRFLGFYVYAPLFACGSSILINFILVIIPGSRSRLLISSSIFFIACVSFTTTYGGFQSLAHCEIVVEYESPPFVTCTKIKTIYLWNEYGIAL